VADFRYNSVLSIVTDFGVAAADLIRVSLNPASSFDEIRRQILLTQPRVLFAEDALADGVGVGWLAENSVLFVPDALFRNVVAGLDPKPPRLPPRNGDSIILHEPVLALRFSGGSTGAPKAILRTVSQQYWVAASLLSDLLPFTAGDRLLQTQPLSVGAHAFTLPAVMRGTTQVLMPKFDADSVIALTEELRITHIKCVPTTLRRLIHSADRHGVPPALKMMIYGAAPAEATLLREALRILGDRVGMAQTYGQAEAPATITRLNAAEHALARAGRDELLSSIGRPYSFTDVLILDEQNRPCLPGVSGEIAVRSPILSSWFWKDGELQPLRPDGSDHRTGDVGRIDQEGFVFLEGRRSEMLITGGYNVFPADVERVIASHPLVEQACVVGVPDPEWGDRICAAVILKNGLAVSEAHAIEEILEKCRALLAGYKIPKAIKIVSEFPTTAAAKVSRREVRKAYFNVPD
jgi:fatty-acyl-CoA synthase